MKKSASHLTVLVSALVAAHLLFAMTLVSCSVKKADDVTTSDGQTQTFTFMDSCQHLTMSLSLQLPTGRDSASLQIRDSLVAEFVRSVCRPCYDNDEEPIEPFKADSDDGQALVDYYGQTVYKRLLAYATYDYEQRMSYLDEDTTMTNEEKEQIRADIPMWEFDLTISKTTDAPLFVVYDASAYCYYGGAHGGVVGAGAMTFVKQTGHKMKRFVREDAAVAMQPLIRKGLLQYYREGRDTLTDAQLSERLLIEDEVIPLPVRTPCPNAAGDSLVFTYEQYEITAYADGMPTFALPVQELLPYLTSEARELISSLAAN